MEAADDIAYISAFRAQAHCRKTLAALAEIKHPKRTTFIHKQNNAIQVNHAVKSSPEKNRISSEVANELLEVKNEQRLDTRAATSPITDDSKMETVASAGVKTVEGKNINKMNAYKHGARRAEIRNMSKKITNCKRVLSQFIENKF